MMRSESPKVHVKLSWKAYVWIWLSLLLFLFSLVLWFVPATVMWSWLPHSIQQMGHHDDRGYSRVDEPVVDALSSVQIPTMQVETGLDNDHSLLDRDVTEAPQTVATKPLDEPSFDGEISRAALLSEQDGRGGLLLVIRSLNAELAQEREKYAQLQAEYAQLKQQRDQIGAKNLSVSREGEGADAQMRLLQSISSDVQKIREDGASLKEALYYLYKQGLLSMPESKANP
ncbi:MAG: hypothetical protein HQM07_04900 [Zetaproteobacteria bacterium]|nr:hypothetical protein [Zetaproteobacteria bacterium]